MTALPFTATFIFTSAALAIAPGPDILYVLAKGISQGRRSALIAAAGFCSGLSIHTAASACGLSALLVASATAFTTAKLLGAAYLIYLGARAIFSRGLISLPENQVALSDRKIFAQAFLMNVLNPKVALFFLAFLPQFIAPGAVHKTLAFLLLGAWMVVQGTLFLFALVLLTARLRGLAGSSIWPRGLNVAGGLLFVGLAARLALAEPSPP